MTHRLTSFLAVVALFAVSWSPVSGQVATVQVDDKAAFVVVNGRPVIALRTSNAGLDPGQRAAIVASRINEMVDQGQPVSKLTVRTEQNRSTMHWGSQAIVYATVQEASLQKTTPSGLAASWLKQLKQQLTLPPVKFTSRSLTVPVDENRRISMVGASVGPFELKVVPEDLVSLKLEPGGQIVVMGRTPGEGKLSVSAPDGSDSIPLRVAEYAGRLTSATPEAQVTGYSVPAEVVGEAAWRAARAACILEPGTRASVSLTAKPAPMSHDRQYQMVPASIRIEGPGFLLAQLSTSIKVTRTSVPKRSVEMLFYSNDPEQVKRHQQLYCAPLSPDKSARLLYHHQNGTGSRLRISITLANVSEEPAKIHIMGALAEPRQDTVLVGYRAGAQFLKDSQSGVGYVTEIPAMSRIVLWTGMLDVMDTASGILEIRQMGNAGQLVMRVLGESPRIYRTTQDLSPVERGDTLGVFSAHQYPSPVRQLSETYTAGSRWLFIRVGKHSIPDSSEDLRLAGNYGVLYDIDLTLDNPTSEHKNIQVMFDPTAGIAGIASIIDGQFIGKSHVVGSRELPLASFRLSPGERRNVRMSTVPLAGSNYPATIVVRS